MWMWRPWNNLLHFPTYFSVWRYCFFSPQNNYCWNRVHFVRVHLKADHRVWQQQSLSPEDWASWWKVSREKEQHGFRMRPWESCQCNQSLTFWAGKSRHLWAVLKRSVSAAVRASITVKGAQKHVDNSQFAYQAALRKQSTGLRASLWRVSTAVVQINWWVISGPRFTIRPAWNAGGCVAIRR